MYRYVGSMWRKIWKEKAGGIKQRAITWRKGPAIVKLERPSRIDRAKRLGYKAKQGFVVTRVRVGRGGMRKKRPRAGRRSKSPRERRFAWSSTPRPTAPAGRASEKVTPEDAGGR